jgi:hypothetical protein
MSNSEASADIVLRAAKSKDWLLCIFFSIDLEGATAYKVETRSRNGDEDWCAVFETFYSDFPRIFFRSYTLLSNNEATKSIIEPEAPTVWKCAGDEILFFAPLTDSRQTLEHVRSFGQSIIDYNKGLNGQGYDIRCKGTVWIAGFPVNNRIVSVPTTIQGGNRTIVDFIGSSIDCGFRLTKFSSSRRLTVSLDLLWLLIESKRNCSEARLFDWIKFRFYGSHELKGVFSGKPYPVFWCDLYQDKTPAEDNWNCLPPLCDNDELIKFCEKTAGRIKSHDFIRPFVSNDPVGLFSTVPEGFELQRKSLLRYSQSKSGTATEKIRQRVDSETDSRELIEPLLDNGDHIENQNVV